MILIYITCSSKKEAQNIASMLLEKRLIACANIFPISSMYWWEEKIQNDNEFVLICKTKDNKYNQIKQEVKKLHSYDTPCILKINAELNEEYENWVNHEIK